MTIALSDLNESQRAAAEWQRGPLLVLAGPGSGKTRILTYRIAKLIADSPGAGFRVLGVTFTNKAASEMRNRIDGLVADGRERVTLTTFHSFAAEILRQHGSHVGLKPDFGILSEQADRKAVLADAIEATPREDSDLELKADQLLPAINRMLDECVPPDGALKWLGTQPHAHEVSKIYSRYREHLIMANQLDFGSLLAISVDLLEKKPAVAKQIRRVYSYVCVDEFQDTNTAQYRLLAQLVPETEPNLFVVADDDQIIYEWNGASPARLEDLRKSYEMAVIQLPENFRCPPGVIALANNLIRNNSNRTVDKQPLLAHKPATESSSVIVESFANFAYEVDWLADKLLAVPLHERLGCVVLARRKKLLETVVSGLTDKSIASYIAVRKNEFQSAPYRWLHAMLRLANARHDQEQLRRVSAAYFELEDVDIAIEDIVARASVDSGDFLRTWLDVAEERNIAKPDTKAMLAKARSALLDRMDYRTFAKAAHEWFGTQPDLQEGLTETTFDEFSDEQEIWKGLVDEIATHYTLSDLSLHNFLQEVDLRAKEKPVPRDAVRCLTIHASKGMEFHHVFLIGLVEDELPSWAAVKKGAESAEIREERRNCFVAITRAEETLTLTYSGEYFGWRKKPSRFLAEMGLSVE